MKKRSFYILHIMTQFLQNLHWPYQNHYPNTELHWFCAPTLYKILQDNHQIHFYQFDILFFCWRINSCGRIVLIGRIGAKRGNVGLTAALKQGDLVTRRLCGLLSKIIGQQMMRCCKRWVEWRLTTRVFDLVAAGEVGIIAFEVEIFAKKTKESCTALAISTN